MENETYKNKIEKEEIEHLPLTSFKGVIEIVDNIHDIQRVSKELLKLKTLGFDTESRPSFSKRRKNNVALLQLSGHDKAYLFRLNKIGLPEALIHMLTNPDLIKVGIAIKDDIKALQKLIHFIPDGFVELQSYVKNFGIEDNGLKKLAANILKIKISKNQQTSNWENHVLTESQKIYAATDAWVCLEIYNRLNHD